MATAMNLAPPWQHTLHTHASYLQPQVDPSASRFAQEPNLCERLSSTTNVLKTLTLLNKQGFRVSRDSIYQLLQECTSKKDVFGARKIYTLMCSNGLEYVPVLGDHLVRLFGLNGSLQEADQVFCRLVNRTVHTWQAIISAHSVIGEYSKALDYYTAMLLEGFCTPNRFIFPAALKACANLGYLEEGEVLHDYVVRCGYELDVFIGNTLIDMYATCGCFVEAHVIFSGLKQRDVVSWNAMIEGCAKNGHCELALDYFTRMQLEGVIPSKPSFLGSLKACKILKNVDMGKKIHEQIKNCDLVSDPEVHKGLIYMYAECGAAEIAADLLNEITDKDVESWNAVMLHLQQHGNGKAVIGLFSKMDELGINPDDVTFSILMKACGSIRDLAWGKNLHKRLMGSGYEFDAAISNALLEMYAKCGSLREARALFDNMEAKDAISWGSMISGYALNGFGAIALELFDKMQDDGIPLDKVILLSVLKACCSVGALAHGHQIHCEVIFNELESDTVIGSTLVEMYARCGCLESAIDAFIGILEKDIVAWGVMIGAYARHGKFVSAIECLYDMGKQGLMPDCMIYTSVLVSCSRARKFEEGSRVFKCMREEHGLLPDLEHLNCMVELFGRTGHLDEAEELLELMPFPTVASGWMSLLCACRSYGNVGLGENCFNKLVSLDPKNSSSYVIMSNIYRNANMWDKAKDLKHSLKQNRSWRKPGKAWIEVNKKIHEFTVGDKTHPKAADLYAKLNELRPVMKNEGYAPQLGLVSDSVPVVKKEEALLGHCEKLAICFGLLSTPKGTTIRVTKNLRVCSDCHDASKIISKIEKRQIIINDSYQVHTFVEGKCCCGD